MTRKNKQSRETIPMLKIFKWLAKFVGHILLYYLIVIFVFDYKIHLLPQSREGYHMEHAEIKDGYKLYPIQYEKDEDLHPGKKYGILGLY